MRGAAAAEERRALYREYLCDAGSVLPCSHVPGNNPRAARVSSACLGGLHCQLIEENYRRSGGAEHGAEGLRRLAKGFEILERVCVNVFLYPWRKEIRTLKKFTGNFVYFVQPVIPEHAAKQILHRAGYTELTETEYLLPGEINPEEAKQTAFELFLARIQCEEIIRLIREDKSDCVNIFFKGSCSERDSETDSEKTAQDFASKNNAKAANFVELRSTEGTNKLHFTGTKLETGGEDLEVTHRKDKLVTSQDIASESLTYAFYNSKHADSEAFLNKYSDLNLAQQPILPRDLSRMRERNVKRREKAAAISPLEESLSAEVTWPVPTSQLPESCALDAEANRKPASEAAWCKGGALVHETVRVSSGKGSDVGKSACCQSKSGDIENPNVNLLLSESPVEFNISKKHGQSERSVTKLKTEKMTDEELAYPVEETLPPENAKPASSSNLSNRESSRTSKSKGFLYDPVTNSAAIGVTFSTPHVMCPISKGVECSADTETARQHVREPPSSLYIPPEEAERQCVRIRDLQPVEDHFQAHSSSAEIVLIDESSFNMNVDTREDFVIISKRENL